MMPCAAYSSSLPPMTVISEESFKSMMNSLPSDGRMERMAWGMMISNIVVI